MDDILVYCCLWLLMGLVHPDIFPSPVLAEADMDFLMGPDGVFTLDSAGNGDDTATMEVVGQLVRQVMEREHLANCHTVLLGGDDSLAIFHIAR